MNNLTGERKSRIIKYLNDAGCKPTLKGYNLFIYLISLSADEPELGCYELFDAYAVELYGDKMECRGTGGNKNKVWWSLYRDCQYTLKASHANMTVYEFIRSGAIKLEETA